MYHTGIIIGPFGDGNTLPRPFGYRNVPVNTLMIFACLDADARDSFAYGLFNSQPLPFFLIQY